MGVTRRVVPGRTAGPRHRAMRDGSRHGGAGVRKHGRRLAPAVTAAATGLVLTVPLVPPLRAHAPLHAHPGTAPVHAHPRTAPAAAHRPLIDTATLRKVRSYHRYQARAVRQVHRARTAARFARRQVGKPYRWGASGPRGYDCSGLVLRAWRKAGIGLPRVSHAQYRRVKRKVPLRRLHKGDLVFFHRRGHVGIYLGNRRFVHAPRPGARVRVDRLRGWRRHAFAGAVRPAAPRHRNWSPYVRRMARTAAAVHRLRSTPIRPLNPPQMVGGPGRPPGIDPPLKGFPW